MMKLRPMQLNFLNENCTPPFYLKDLGECWEKESRELVLLEWNAGLHHVLANAG